MDETPIPRPTRPYVAIALAVAVLLGMGVGVGVGLLWQTVLPAIIAGAAVTLLVAASTLLAVRRSGRGTIEGAPPWAPDAQTRIRGVGPN